jgi:GTP-binding protein
MEDDLVNLDPLMDLILEKVPAASGDNLVENPLKAQIFNLAYDNFLGRMGIARIYEGKIKQGQTITIKNEGEENFTGKVVKLFSFKGVQREESSEGTAGDIVMIAGIPEIFIGQTLVDDENTEAMAPITVDQPTISVNMFVNDSPFSGKIGKFLTSRQIRERLEKELEMNVGLKIDLSDDSKYKVYGRGELHLAVLIENMRREGFELAISPPEAIVKEIDGVKSEPFEEVSIFVPEEFTGSIIEKLGKRKGVMINMEVDEHGQAKMVFEVPTRGILGYRNEFIVDTKGEGIFTSLFLDFKPYAGEISKTQLGSMISMTTGKVLAFSLANLQDRGVLYMSAGDEVYEGQIVGNTSKGEDMTVNPTKGKQLTNMRASGSDGTVKLTPPMKLDLEKAMGLMREDEFLEVTPDGVRLRKQFLKEGERKKNGSKV